MTASPQYDNHARVLSVLININDLAHVNLASEPCFFDSEHNSYPSKGSLDLMVYLN